MSMLKSSNLCPFTFGIIGFLLGLLHKSTVSNFQVFAAHSVSSSSDSGYSSSEIFDTEDVLNDILQHGFPSYDTIRTRKSYVLSYDRRNKVPNWVCENLTPTLLQRGPNVTRKKSWFFEDENIHPYFRSTLDDYKDNEYDRGHLAAASNHKYSQELMDDTFVLSNVAPQVGIGFNQGAWNNLENHVRSLVPKYKSVFVCSGPLYLPRQIVDPHTGKQKKYIIYEVVGKNNVAVPTHFYKIVVCDKGNEMYDMESYIMPNQPINKTKSLRDFMVSRDMIERAAGLLFFQQLPSSAFQRINGKSTSKINQTNIFRRTSKKTSLT